MRAGQKVVCIHQFTSDKYDDETYPTVGEIYTVRGFDGSPDWIYLNEIINPHHDFSDKKSGECSFFAERFRPVDETFGEQVAESIEEVLKEQPEHLTA